MSQTKAAGMQDALSAHCHPLQLLSHPRSVAQEEFFLSILYPQAAAILWGGTKPGSNHPQISSCGEQPCPLLLLDGDGFRRTGRRSFYQEKLQLLEQLCCPQLPTKDPKPKGEGGGGNVSFQALAFFLNF